MFRVRPVAQFYFHVSSNGQSARDARGQAFDNLSQACWHAVERTPHLLSAALQKTNTYVTIEVCDAARTVWVVRATITVEQRAQPALAGKEKIEQTS